MKEREREGGRVRRKDRSFSTALTLWFVPCASADAVETTVESLAVSFGVAPMSAREVVVVVVVVVVAVAVAVVVVEERGAWLGVSSSSSLSSSSTTFRRFRALFPASSAPG